MVMMTFLRQPDICFKSEHLRAILTHGAVHCCLARKNFGHAFREGLKNFRMIAEIPRLNKLNFRILLGNSIRESVDTVDQNTAE